jgi:predicted nicotinamide N-methyase
MLLKKNKKSQVHNYHKEKVLSDDLFQKSLYRNAHLLRIVLHKPIQQHIQIDKWYRIDLKLVTEMGLLVNQHQHKIQLSCQILINNMSKPAFPIEIRPISEDAWNPEVAQSMGFLASKAVGGLEYRITSNLTLSPLYISLQVTDRQSPTILPLTVGPVWLQEPLASSQNWGSKKELGDLEHQQYRALQTHSNGYFLLKEQWHTGTPGKIWDSAIVMTDIFKSVFETNPYQFSGKRILDLSAGTGYIGLSLAQLYQQRNQSIIPPPYVTLTDLPEALQLIKENQTLNNIQSTSYLNIEPLSWGNKKDADYILANGKLDIVIASDVLYNVDHFPELVSTLQDLCNEDTFIYLCYKQRGLTIQEERSFFKQCKVKFNITLLKQFKHETGVKMYRLKKKADS